MELANLWLGEKRGYLTDWVTQRWVEWTGRRVTEAEVEWLSGPSGNTRRIGRESAGEIAAQQGLKMVTGPGVFGLMPDFSSLAGPLFSPSAVGPGVAHFYEQTSCYEMDAWAHWTGCFQPIGRLLAWIFSRRLQQLNVPLTGLDASRGVRSTVIPMVDGRTGDLRFTAWIRELVQSGHTVYAGFYSTCTPPGWQNRCVKVVFPLPNGNATVIMKPSANPDGSLTLTSAGTRFGDPGFYFTIRQPDGHLIGRYVSSVKEVITVFPEANGEVRADHSLTYFGLTVFKLHYRMRRNGPP